jgi:hypothetical protein
MRMRQSLAQLEESFEQATAQERHRRREIKQDVVQRTRVRRRAKIEQGQKLRFLLLLTAIAVTVVGVTIAMFETLAWLLG